MPTARPSSGTAVPPPAAVRRSRGSLSAPTPWFRSSARAAWATCGSRAAATDASRARVARQAPERRADRQRRRATLPPRGQYSRPAHAPPHRATARRRRVADGSALPGARVRRGRTDRRDCDRHRLDVDARLRLFLDVLDAVAHAHANLIVHRDIKPSNVLVSNDGQVSSWTSASPSCSRARARAERRALTREGGRALTPEFAAPEQVLGGAVTTATDVYALGILLYVLLTGQPSGGGRARSPPPEPHQSHRRRRARRGSPTSSPTRGP